MAKNCQWHGEPNWVDKMAEKFCVNCGNKLPDKAVLCIQCGRPVSNEKAIRRWAERQTQQGTKATTERVLLTVTQSRLRGGSLVSPHSIIVTNRALRMKDPRTFGLREDMTELPYEHIHSIKKKGGLRGVKLVISSGSHGTIDLEGISGEDADKIIALVHQHKTSPPPMPTHQPPTSGMSLIDELKKIGRT